MVLSFSLEHCVLRSKDDSATLSYADGVEVKLPRNVFHRSRLLHQTVSEARCESEVLLELPKGVVRAWMEGLRAVGINTSMPKDSVIPPASELCCDIQSTIKSLEAADFLDDKGTMRDLCTLAATHLFEPYITCGDPNIDGSVAEELLSLPCNLQREVLAASRVPFLIQLTLLPLTLHEIALHAAFPAITTTLSITVPFPLFASSFSIPFWKMLAKETSLRELNSVSLPDQSREMYYGNALLSCISRLTGLKSLTVAPILGDPATSCEANLLRLASHKYLTHLDLSLVKGSPTFHKPCVQIHRLMSVTALQSLSIRRHLLSDSFVPAFGEAITRLSALWCLDMTHCLMFEPESDVMAECLSRCKALRDLRCDGALGSVDFVHVTCSFRQLTRLDLPRQVLKRQLQPLLGLREAQMLSGLSQLRVLHLPCAWFSVSDWLYVTRSISGLTQLRKLRISDLPGEGICALDALVPSLCCLQLLQVTVKRTTPRSDPEEFPEEWSNAFQPFGACLASARTLTHLSLKDSKPFAATLYSSLCSLNLEHLTITDSKLDCTAMEHIAAPIAQMSLLKSLSLSGNYYRADGLLGLAVQLSNLCCLQELSLRRIGVCDESGILLLRNLQWLTALNVLEMNETALGDDGVIALAPALEVLTKLSRLTLRENAITCTGARVLAANLTCTDALQNVGLCGNNIKGEGARLLTQCIRVLPCLTVLDLRLNAIGSKEELELCDYTALIVSGVNEQFKRP